MSPTVFLEHFVTEVFDAQAQPRDAKLFERFDFVFLKRSRLAFERHLFGLVPANVGSQPIHQRRQLLAAQKRRRASTKVDESERPIAHHR